MFGWFKKKKNQYKGETATHKNTIDNRNTIEMALPEPLDLSRIPWGTPKTPVEHVMGSVDLGVSCDSSGFDSGSFDCGGD